MSWVQNMSIGRKLMVIIMAISGLTLLLACFAIVGYDIIELRRGMVSDASTLANMVAENSTPPSTPTMKRPRYGARYLSRRR